MPDASLVAPRSKARRPFLILFLPLAVLVIAAMLFVGKVQVEGDLSNLGASETTRVRVGGVELARGLEKVPTHLRSLESEGPIRAAIDAPTADNLAGMAAAFETLLQRNPEYDQVRWIDQTGMEKIRVNRSKDGVGVEVVPGAKLQNKSDRSYFTDTELRGIGEIVVSRLDLNVDNGKVSIPYRPTIRFAVVIAGANGARRGILIINYLATSLLKSFLNTVSSAGGRIMLLNRDGYFLYSPNPADEWGFMFGRTTTLSNQYPSVWARIMQSGAGRLIDQAGFWNWQTITIGTDMAGPADSAKLRTWIVVSRIPSDILRAVYYRTWAPTALIGVLLILVFAVLSWHIAIRAVREREALEARVKAETTAAEGQARADALEKAQEIGAKLAAIVESTHDAIIGKKLDGTVMTWNQGAEKLFGYPADEIIGRSITILLPPERQHEEGKILERISRGETVTHFETQRRRKNGSTIDVSVTISPIRDTAGLIVGASKIARDITEAKHAQAELARHRAHLEDLVEERTAQIAEVGQRLQERDKFITTVTDNLPGMVGYWDRELRCRFANRAYLDWFGRSSDKMLGMTVWELLGEELFALNRPAIDAVLGGEPQQFERRVPKPSGEIGYTLSHYIPDREGDSVVGFFVLATDITTVKHAEQKLRRINDRLQDAVAAAEGASTAKSQFLANMSHEIRTPMNGVIGMLEILGHTRLDDEQIRMIDTINGSAGSLMHIIDDILDLSKIEAGQLRVEAIACDPTEIVESTTRLFLGAASAKGLTLRCFAAPEVCGRFLMDPVRLRQILSNLVSNAVKFTPRGSVTVTVEGAGAETSAELRFVVADTGIGIAPEVQARLFQPFTQADDSTARKFGGTGLGLSICLRLAGLMGGGIALTSEQGKGTQLSLTIPVRPVAGEGVGAVLDLCGVHVALLASDDLEQYHLASYLTHWGAQVTAITGASVPAPTMPPATIFLAPSSAMPLSRTLASDSGIMAAEWQRRFVFYAHEDVPVDTHPATDAIATTALSRARIITAIAVTAGRMTAEVEATGAIPRLERQDGASRDDAIRLGKLILLAEDHPVNRDVILRQLRLLGYAADAVEDGAKALAALVRTRYGLLLTDCNMPEMDGFELVRCLRWAETGGSRLPVIALTANALDGEEQRCLAAGMDDYLAKPVKLATLRAHLERWLLRKPEPAAGPPPDARTAKAGAAEPPLSLAVLAEFCGDDPAVIRDTLERYVASLKADFERIAAAASKNDAEKVELFAHRMKGAARMVGGEALAICSEAMELAAGKRDWPAIRRDLPPLSEAVTRVDQMYTEITSA